MDKSNSGTALVAVNDLQKWYPVRASLFARQRTYVKAVDNVSFDVFGGEILGLVGESGSGKTTVGRTILRLSRPTGGTIRFSGQDITHASRKNLRPIRRKMQLIFQDPFASLNPRMTVGRILATPLMIHEPQLTRAERKKRIDEALRLVGLSPSHAARYPHEFSGGQRQRVGIARALMLKPDFLVADEPVSSLDVSIQAQVVNLLLELKQRLGLTILFIAHDLAVVAHICDRIAVMYLGRMVEIAPTQEILLRPHHPYTEALLSAVPIPDPTRRSKRIVLAGDIPSPINPPAGCPFHTRCRYAEHRCASTVPTLALAEKQHKHACLRSDILPLASAYPTQPSSKLMYDSI